MWWWMYHFKAMTGERLSWDFRKVGLEICSFLLTSEVRHWCWRLAENVPVHPSRVWWRFFAGSVFFQHQTSKKKEEETQIQFGDFKQLESTVLRYMSNHVEITGIWSGGQQRGNTWLPSDRLRMKKGSPDGPPSVWLQSRISFTLRLGFYGSTDKIRCCDPHREPVVSPNLLVWGFEPSQHTETLFSWVDARPF